MARRKSDSVKWTLVLCLVILSPLVLSRPQVESSSTLLSVENVETDKPTENLLRYSYNNNKHESTNHSFKLPLVNVIANDTVLNDVFSLNQSLSLVLPNIDITTNIPNRRSRLIRRINKIRQHQTQNKTNDKQNGNINSVIKSTSPGHTSVPNRYTNKPNIKRVITKWMDSAKYEDLNISHESSISNERDAVNFASMLNVNVNHEYSSANSNNDTSTKNKQNSQLSSKRVSFVYNDPQYSEETQIYSDNYHVIDNPYSHVRPNFIYSTPRPTPVITNVGYPQPWPGHNVPNRPTTQKPIKSTTVKYPYNNHHNFVNNFSPYPGNDFEVTTFPPAGVYTDRIVIRPEEYNASPDECPTIFVSLNNTFQGQGKEACPDLNIAVNTNVVNKNVVVESDEDTDTTLTDVFGLPSDDESGSDENFNDYAESQENDDETESASIEDSELSNYNAANSVIDAESSESDNIASPSSALSAISRPGRPNDDDDIFSFSALIDFFRPALGALSWLASINPLSFSAISFLLTPFVLLIAGASGLATLFSPWALSGREGPELFYYKPKWQWENSYQPGHIDSFPHNRRWIDQPRRSLETYKIGATRLNRVLDNVKVLLKRLTKNMRKNRKVRKRKR